MPNLSHDELREKAQRLLADIDSIKTQIDSARATAAATGEYADREWFIRANHALRVKQRQHQALLIEIGRAGKAERKARAVRFETVFIETARELVPQEQFNTIFQLARIRFRAQEDQPQH